MVRPEKARSLEDLLISAARNGRLSGSAPTGQVTESDLVGLLERISDQQKPASSSRITFQRRGTIDDEDEDY